MAPTQDKEVGWNVVSKVIPVLSTINLLTGICVIAFTTNDFLHNDDIGHFDTVVRAICITGGIGSFLNFYIFVLHLDIDPAVNTWKYKRNCICKSPEDNRCRSILSKFLMYSDVLLYGFYMGFTAVAIVRPVLFHTSGFKGSAFEIAVTVCFIVNFVSRTIFGNLIQNMDRVGKCIIMSKFKLARYCCGICSEKDIPDDKQAMLSGEETSV